MQRESNQSMSRIAYFLIASLAFAAGCKTAGSRRPASARPAPAAPPAVTSPAPVKAVSAPSPREEKRKTEREAERYREEISRLEKTVAGQRETQERLNAQLRAIQEQLQQAQTQLQQLQGGTLDSDMRLARSETAIEKLKEAAPSAEAKPAGDRELKKAAEEAQRRVSTQEVLIEQKEREIRDLRKAIAARDEQFKDRTLGADKPAAATNAPVAEAAVKPAPPAAAVTSPPPRRAVAEQAVAEGQRLMREGKVVEAEVSFARALAIHPKSDDAAFGVASCRYAAGDAAAAKKLLDDIIRRSRRHGPAHGLAGMIALRQGDLRAARDHLERAVKRDEKNARLHTNLAIAYDGLNKKNAAMKELRKAIALDPNLAEARFNLAILLASMKPPKLTEAKHHYQTALQLGSTRDEKLEKILYP